MSSAVPHPGQADRASATESLPPRERVGSLHWRLLAFEAAFRPLPPFIASRLRTQSLRLTGVRIGSASIFWGMPKLVGTGPITERLTVGTYCGFNEGCFFELEADIEIGNHVAVGHDVMFLTRGAHVGGAAQRAGAPKLAPIVVREAAWIGSRCVILPGVTIGASSVIGAGLVVSKDVPDNTLLTGGPPVSIARWR